MRDLSCVCRVLEKQLSRVSINGRKQIGIVSRARMRGTCGMRIIDAVKIVIGSFVVWYLHKLLQ